MTAPNETDFDVAIVGGSYAGMAAALQLARARRSVLVIDADQPRNRFAEESRGFLTHDGSSPGHMTQVAREQLMAYSTVTWREGTVEQIEGEEGNFTLRMQAGNEATARLIILATGVVDHFPDIQGLEERWGGAAFTCPYCHGYELQEGKIAVIATGESSFDKAMMMPEWGEVTFFTNDVVELDEVQTRALDIKDVTVEASPIERISGKATIELAGGKTMEFDGIALTTKTSMSELPSMIGCELEGEEGEQVVKVDSKQATTVEGVFACGDIANPLHNISFAVADGTLAGTAAHSQLMQTD